ncbi:MAG: fused response regulator/thioredoxin-disulfide reductase [Chloroflexi bacterium]|nr:MAG: fused response regulator/thioredoxin-disulfide reductase [Chloroflexota bacterium]
MAAKPAILAVDDDPPVLRAVERDLRARYGREYRILAAGSGEEALEVTRQLSLRGTAVALFVVDQRMPRVTGIEFLSRAVELQPEARRVLLTAYADTDVAIQAINQIRLDQYLLKPWDPPEERLYPVLDDLLSDWSAAFRPPFDGLRLIARRWAPRGHAIRDFLTRNQVPYQWLDPDTDEEGRRLAASAQGAPAGAGQGEERGDGQGDLGAAAPLVVFPDGAVLRDPSNREIGERIGLQTRAALPFYDLVIVGGGPAGLAAAVYGASEGLKTVLVEREAPGGQAGTTSRIENYLGFPAGLTGGDLARRALAQARRLGAEILTPQEVRSIRREDPYRIVKLEDGGELSCQTVVVATGVSYRTLRLPGAEELAGAGIYYGAATTEAALYRDQEVGVVGGGNSAGQAAVYLARVAKRVVLAVRGDTLSGMSQYLVDQIGAEPRIEVRYRVAVTALRGEGHLDGVTLACDGTTQDLPLSALFVFIGQQPRTDWLDGTALRDPGGFIRTGSALLDGEKPPPGWALERDPFLLESSVPGIFAAGDVRHRSIKRIASAVGEGSMAVQFVHQYLAGL